MRLWSIHPKYLDVTGLVALWREALLAQAVLAGKTRGYKNHPQLYRFMQGDYPSELIATYLWGVYQESIRRGFDFDISRISHRVGQQRLQVTKGQIAYEMEHLKNKLRIRDQAAFARIKDLRLIKPHPIFDVVKGDIEEWEKVG